MSSTKMTIRIKTVFLIMLVLLFVYSSFTYIRSNYSFFIAIGGYIVFWVLTSINHQRWSIGYISVWAILALVGSFLFVINGAEERLTTYVSGIIYIFFWFNAFLYLANNYSRKETIVFSSICLITVFICVISTLRVLRDYPLAARAMNGLADGITVYDTTVFQRMGCGGYGFIYGCVFIGLALLCGIKSKLDDKRQRIILIVLYLIFAYLIVQSLFTTAFLLMLICIALSMLIDSRRYILSIIIVCIAGLVLLTNYQDLLSGLANIASDLGATFISNKLNMLRSSVGSNDVESLARAQRYMTSINGFLSNPITGSGISGGHSQILDTLSVIGLLGVSYIALLLSIFKQMRRYINNKYVTILEIITFFLALFNPLVDSTLISITFMLAPALLYSFAPNIYLSKNKEKQPNEGTLDYK